MKTVYISGPISNIKDGNKDAFKHAQILLEHAEYEVLNPHEICSEINPSNYKDSNDFWYACMRACIKSMMDADLVVLLHGFTDSKGAMVEFNLAIQLGIKTITIEKLKL